LYTFGSFIIIQSRAKCFRILKLECFMSGQIDEFHILRHCYFISHFPPIAILGFYAETWLMSDTFLKKTKGKRLQKRQLDYYVCNPVEIFTFYTHQFNELSSYNRWQINNKSQGAQFLWKMHFLSFLIFSSNRVFTNLALSLWRSKLQIVASLTDHWIDYKWVWHKKMISTWFETFEKVQRWVDFFKQPLYLVQSLFQGDAHSFIWLKNKRMESMCFQFFRHLSSMKIIFIFEIAAEVDIKSIQ